MKVNVTGRHMHVQDALKSYAQEKAGKLERYFDQLREIEVIISDNNGRKSAEIICHPRRGERIVGQAEHDDQFAAIDLLMDKMYQQLHKAKEKLKDKRKRTSGRVPPPPLPPSEEDKLESYDDVVDRFSQQFESH